LTTKIHVLSDPWGLPIKLALTPGQVHDSQAAPQLLGALPAASVVLADKAYDAQWIRDRIAAQGATANIPSPSYRKRPHRLDRKL
jgi:transposase